MKKITKIVSSTTAAAVLAGIGSTLIPSGSSTLESPYADDVAAVAVQTPKIILPKVNVPKLELPKVLAGKISSVEIISLYDAEKFGLNAIEINQPETKRISVIQPAAKTSGVELAAVGIPAVVNPADRIPRVQALMALQKKLFRDQRNILYDRTLSIDNISLSKWISIYQKNEAYTPKFVELEKGLRLIAEIHYPADAAILDKNLEFYASKGYNGVLLTFGYSDKETIGDLVTLAEYVKSKELKVFFAFAGPESLSHTVFINPEKYAFWLSSLARVCDGFIIGWRRTSAHLFEQDEQWITYTLKSVRSGNPDIPVIGEAYYGQTYSSNESSRCLHYNIPENSSAVMIAGLGLNGVSAELCMNDLLSKIKDLNRIALIVGDKPYYGTTHNNGKSFPENLVIKQKLEQRWIKAGCSGTITLHGDGSDLSRNKHNDNLGSMEVQ